MRTSDAICRLASSQVNPYLNTSPTELARRVKTEQDLKKRALMQKALDAWRATIGNPMAPDTTISVGDIVNKIVKTYSPLRTRRDYSTTDEEDRLSSSLAYLSRVAGVFDPIKDRRMDWLWEYDPKTQTAIVREEVLDTLEGVFYGYLEQEGWPKPVSSWVLAMGIQGGAASYQWHENSDVDVQVVIDWRRLFRLLSDQWPESKWRALGLDSQWDRIQQGKRLQGRLIAKMLNFAIAGRGPWQGKGIRNKPVLERIAPTHPVDFQITRGLHTKDLRFDDQPPVVDVSNLSSYLVDLPVKRRRDEEGRSKRDTQWINEIESPPPGFNLKRDAPDLYQEGLSQLRYVTMSFDYLYDPDSPKDLIKALKVLRKRFSKFMSDRTKGYREWADNPGIYTVDYKGKTYGHPDWFPTNIAVKLLEKLGPKDGKKLIKKVLREYRDGRYIEQNFDLVRDEIRDLIGPNYLAIRNELSRYSARPFRYKDPSLV